MFDLEQNADGLRFMVRVQPNARQTALVGLRGEALKITVRAPALEGKANRELIAFLARLLDVPRSRIAITRGEKSRDKSISLTGGRPDDLLSALRPHLERLPDSEKSVSP